MSGLFLLSESNEPEEQIIVVLKEHESGRRPPIWRAISSSDDRALLSEAMVVWREIAELGLAA
jgi:hypothetical protein